MYLLCKPFYFHRPHSLANVALCTSSLPSGSRDSIQQLVMMVWAINTVTFGHFGPSKPSLCLNHNTTPIRGLNQPWQWHCQLGNGNHPRLLQWH